MQRSVLVPLSCEFGRIGQACLAGWMLGHNACQILATVQTSHPSVSETKIRSETWEPDWQQNIKSVGKKQRSKESKESDRWELNIYFLWHCSPARAMASSSTGFLGHTQRRATVGRPPLDEWSARRRDHYLTTHNRQSLMPPVGFEPTIAAGERPLGPADESLILTLNLGQKYVGVWSRFTPHYWNGSSGSEIGWHVLGYSGLG
jgi:hypothetical protein